MAAFFRIATYFTTSCSPTKPATWKLSTGRGSELENCFLLGENKTTPNTQHHSWSTIYIPLYVLADLRREHLAESRHSKSDAHRTCCIFKEKINLCKNHTSLPFTGLLRSRNGLNWKVQAFLNNSSLCYFGNVFPSNPSFSIMQVQTRSTTPFFLLEQHYKQESLPARVQGCLPVQPSNVGLPGAQNTSSIGHSDGICPGNEEKTNMEHVPSTGQ